MTDRSLRALSVQIDALMRQHRVEMMCQNPPDCWSWVESPFLVHLGERGFDAVHGVYAEWDRTAPLEHRCFVISRVDYANDFREACEGLALEAAYHGGRHRLDYVLSELRPDFLPNMQAYLLRGRRAFADAGSPEALREIAQSYQRELTARRRMEEERAAALRVENTHTASDPEAEAKVAAQLLECQRVGKLVLQKSSQTMDSIMGLGSAELFLRGEEIIIRGNRFAYAVSGDNRDHVKNSYQTGGSIPYKLELRTLENETLAKGCLVVTNTPVLDQVTTLFLYVKSGEEQAVLDTTVWSQRTALYKEHFPEKALKGIDVEDGSDIGTYPDDHFTRGMLIEANEMMPMVYERLSREMARVTIGHIFTAEPAALMPRQLALT